MAVLSAAQGERRVEYPIGTHEILTLPFSFETGEQGAVDIPFPQRARILEIESIVTKALAATDAGTVTAASSTGAMANGVVSHAASAAQGNKVTVQPTTNRIIAKGTDLTLTPAKTTAGGKVMVTVHFQRLAN